MSETMRRGGFVDLRVGDVEDSPRRGGFGGVRIVVDEEIRR